MKVIIFKNPSLIKTRHSTILPHHGVDCHVRVDQSVLEPFISFNPTEYIYRKIDLCVENVKSNI